MKEKKECCKCHKLRVIYSGGMCQICYRKHLKNVKLNGNYFQTNPTLNIVDNEILSLFLKENLKRKQIHNIINSKYNKYNYSYICKVIQKYTKLEVNGGGLDD